jgi:hypothetical protein
MRDRRFGAAVDQSGTAFDPAVTTIGTGGAEKA